MISNKRTTPDCPICGEGVLLTKDSRPAKEPNALRRRRKECSKCGAVVTTQEVIVGEAGYGQMANELAVSLFLDDVSRAAKERFATDALGRLLKGSR